MFCVGSIIESIASELASKGQALDKSRWFHGFVNRLCCALLVDHGYYG